MRVIIVDDCEPRASRIALLLTAEGFEVELGDATTDAEPALVIAAGTGAHELCRALRGAENRRVLMLSSADTDAVLAAIDAGADAFLTPPFSDARLVASVRRLLGNSLAERTATFAKADEVTMNLPREQLVELLLCALEDGAHKLDHTIDPQHHYQFMAVVAHELRNPLQSLLLRAQLANSGEARALAALPPMVDAKVNAVVRFIGEMLDVTELDVGHVQLDRQRVPLLEVVRDAIARASDDSHNVALRVADDLPQQIEADRERLGRIVENYVHNAFKYAPPNAAIDASIERRGDLVRVSVTDHGVPIPAADREQVFTPFYRRQGVLTGLALYMNRRLAELHHGRVGVDGTTFWVELPVEPER